MSEYKTYTTEVLLDTTGILYGDRAKKSAKEYSVNNGVEVGDKHEHFDALFIYAYTTEGKGFWRMVGDRVMRYLEEEV